MAPERLQCYAARADGNPDRERWRRSRCNRERICAGGNLLRKTRRIALRHLYRLRLDFQ